MAEANSTETKEKRDYLDFISLEIADVFAVHALIIGIKVIIENNDWEVKEDLRAAFNLLHQAKYQLEDIASTLDASSFSYVAKG